jgi:hypothetical protein
MGGTVNSCYSTLAYDISTMIGGYHCLEECTVSNLGVNMSQVGEVAGYKEFEGRNELWRIGVAS